MIESAYAASQQEPSLIGFLLPIFILVLMGAPGVMKILLGKEQNPWAPWVKNSTFHIYIYIILFY